MLNTEALAEAREAWTRLRPDDIAAMRRIGELQRQEKAILARRPILVAVLETAYRAGLISEHPLIDTLAEVRNG